MFKLEPNQGIQLEHWECHKGMLFDREILFSHETFRKKGNLKGEPTVEVEIVKFVKIQAMRENKPGKRPQIWINRGVVQGQNQQKVDCDFIISIIHHKGSWYFVKHQDHGCFKVNFIFLSVIKPNCLFYYFYKILTSYSMQNNTPS